MVVYAYLMNYEYTKDGVENLIEMLCQPDNAQIKQASDLLKPFFKSPDAPGIFLEIIANPKSSKSVLASLIFLKFIIEIQWDNLTPEAKAELFTTFAQLYFQSSKYKMKCIDIIQLFLTKDSDFFQLLIPHLTQEITPENINTLILFYLDFMKFIPIEFIEQNIQYIGTLVNDSFNANKDNLSNISVEVQIASFRVATYIAINLQILDLVEVQFESIFKLITEADLTDSQYNALLDDLKSIGDLTIENEAIQALIFSFASFLIANQELIPSRRNYAIILIESQIESGIVPKEQIYLLIAQNFEIFALQIDIEDDFTFSQTNVIQYAVHSIESSELFENVFQLIATNLESQDIKLITTSIYFLSFLMSSCPIEFSEHQTESIQILQQALQPTSPPIIQFAALHLIQEIEDNFDLFPSMLCEQLLSIVFNSDRSPDPITEYFIENVLEAFYSLTKISTFNNRQYFDLLWSNKEQFIEIDAVHFFQILFHCAIGIDELPDQILQELLALVLTNLDLETDPNLLKESLLLVATLVNFNHEIWPCVAEKIHFLIDAALKSEIPELHSIIDRFLYIFVDQLKHFSFEMIGQPFGEQICESLSLRETNRSIMALAAICLYWNKPQLAPIVYRYALSHLNQTLDDDYLIEDSPYVMLQMITSNNECSKCISDQESLALFKYCAKQAENRPRDIIELMHNLIECASEPNKDEFIDLYNEMVQQLIANNNQDINMLNVIYELSGPIFSIQTEKSIQYFAQFVPLVIEILQHYGEISNSAIDFYIGILSEAFEKDRIDQNLVQPAFMAVFQILLQEPSFDMWQNISFFFNCLLKKYPQVLDAENFPLSSFVMTLFGWLQSTEIDDDQTFDNIASLLLTISSVKRIDGNEQMLQLSIARFPPTDVDEMIPMATSIIKIASHQPQYPINVYCQIAASIAAFLTMSEKKKARFQIDEQIVTQFTAILNELLKSQDVVEFLKNYFQDQPEKLLQISQSAS